MHSRTLFRIFATLAVSITFVRAQEATEPKAIVEEIKAAAVEDNVDFSVLSFAESTLANIAETLASIPPEEDEIPVERRNLIGRFLPRQQNNDENKRVDVHTHLVPDWYRQLVPLTGGNPTPSWNLTAQEAHMASLGITHSILAISAPGANVFPGNKAQTVSLARLLNEQVAAIVKANKKKYSFLAVVPLPYTAEAITEARYALNKLNAAGIIVQANTEGKYLGDPAFRQFFVDFNNLGGDKQIMYIHPGASLMNVNNQLIEVNPTRLPAGRVEFYFETARTLMDLTVTQTLHNFTNIHYIIPHLGGAFPSIIDRLLRSQPALLGPSMAAYTQRFWWDSAGPTFFNQINGLLSYGFSKSQLLFGTDFPYAPPVIQQPSFQAIINTPALTAAEKTSLFYSNAKALFGSKIKA